MAVGIALLPALFDQVDGLIAVLPSGQARQGKAAPPHLIQEANGPGRLAAGPSHQAVARVFLSRVLRVGVG
jgi:hypothetical protein